MYSKVSVSRSLGQSGFALFELLLSAAVMLLIAVWSSQALINRINDAEAQNIASWMLTVRQGIQTYLEQYGDVMRRAQTPADMVTQGYQDWMAPTLSELKSDGLLSSGFPDRIQNIEGVHIQVMRDGDCPGDYCRLGALIYSRQALLKARGMVDEYMLAQWQLAAKGLGGIVHPLQPHIIRGHTFQHDNQLRSGAILPPGTVAMSISNEQLSERAYLRVYDTRDPQFQSDATIAGNVVAAGVVSAGRHLHLGTSEQWLTSCSEDGAVTRDAVYGLLLCSHGYWQSASRSAGGFSINSLHGCYTPDKQPSANPITRSCSCPVGHIAVPISEGGSDTGPRGITRGYLCVH